jgi:hypothetical protein
MVPALKSISVQRKPPISSRRQAVTNRSFTIRPKSSLRQTDHIALISSSESSLVQGSFLLMSCVLIVGLILALPSLSAQT